VTQPIASRLHSQLESIAELFGFNPDLAFVVAVHAECHPHHAVEAALVAMAEAHHRDLPQSERTSNVQLRCGLCCCPSCCLHCWLCPRRHHKGSLRRSTDTSVQISVFRPFTLVRCRRQGQRFPGSGGCWGCLGCWPVGLSSRLPRWPALPGSFAPRRLAISMEKQMCLPYQWDWCWALRSSLTAHRRGFWLHVLILPSDS